MLDPADEPQGKWSEAIDYLHDAERLMAEMIVDLGNGTESHNLAQVYRQYVTSAERAIKHHWRMSYMEQVNRMPKARVDNNGHMKLDVAE